jgi:hypothetical protein
MASTAQASGPHHGFRHRRFMSRLHRYRGFALAFALVQRSTLDDAPINRRAPLYQSRQSPDAETDAHLWADRFDRDIGDMFALQNDITGRIAVALDGVLIGAETSRPTDHPDALDYILRGEPPC